MIKNWIMFSESVLLSTSMQVRDINLKKFNYTKEDLQIAKEIKDKSDKIEKEYGFNLNFHRFDDLGLPFIDISEKDKNRAQSIFAVYDIKERKFSIWQTYSDSTPNWEKLVLSSNMEIKYEYLYIMGDFFEQIDRLYYIYYE